ncbi:MAG: hypothetical protein BYD32DRAFT_231885 [Podila humilis]|nr:MAG: hypothetical protein BYD32DRAFT_231885 [Podila humilis]
MCAQHSTILSILSFFVFSFFSFLHSSILLLLRSFLFISRSMSQHDKLPYTQPHSSTPEHEVGPPNLHQYFVVATFTIYFTFDIVASIFSVPFYGTTPFNFICLFFIDAMAVFYLRKYSSIKKTPKYDRILSCYFGAVGFLYPLTVAISIWVDKAQGNEPYMYFDRGYQGVHIVYCSTRGNKEIGYAPDFSWEDKDKGSRFCWSLYTTSKLIVMLLSLGIGAVHLVTKRRASGQGALST